VVLVVLAVQVAWHLVDEAVLVERVS